MYAYFRDGVLRLVVSTLTKHAPQNFAGGWQFRTSSDGIVWTGWQWGGDPRAEYPWDYYVQVRMLTPEGKWDYSPQGLWETYDVPNLGVE